WHTIVASEAIGIRAIFGSDLALVAAIHSGSRPALIESGWKRIGSSSEGRHLKLKLVRRIKAGQILLPPPAPPPHTPEKRKNSCLFGVHSENLGYVYFLYENCCPRRRRVCFVSF